ncbi:uncharacterized protein Kmn2 [Eurosta solidaginis]|uniref:uncharacterized protein Kmn2 n=1 Tax=Eurosta solidaginis TaxID=178769 RepID=UPI0035314165
MDERLQQIFHLKPLQEETITYRSNMRMYKTLMKQTCRAELHNLVNVVMDVSCTEIKMVDQSQIPQFSEPRPDLTPKIDTLREEIKMTSIGMKLL